MTQKNGITSDLCPYQSAIVISNFPTNLSHHKAVCYHVLLRFWNDTKHFTDSFLLVDVILLQQLLVQPLGVCDARNWIRHLMQQHICLPASITMYYTQPHSQLMHDYMYHFQYLFN